MKTILAIDPGAKGAAAFFLNGKLMDGILAFDKDKDWRNSLFFLCKLLKPDIAILEKTHSWRGQGVKSMHSFGQRKGEADTILHLAKIPIQLVEPAEWQKRLGLLRKPKSENKKLALELFPQLKDIKGDIYDAVLIGWSIVKSQC